MPEESLKHKTKKGLYWSAAGNFANIGMNFVFGIILARLLTPDAYGVIGMLSVFMAVVGVFIDCGFSQSLIRKQDRTQTDFSTEFYFNIVVGIVGYLILFVASPYIAEFYNMSILSPILKVIGLGVIFNSLCVVQSSQFAIRLDFKTPAKISVSTHIFTGIIGIIMAYSGWGVWALVFQQLAGNVLRTILLWILAKWRPTWEFSKESFRYQWNFGSKLLAVSLMQKVYDNIYPLVIGKFFSSNILGLYSRAQGFATLPSSNFSSVLKGVTFPVLSTINDDVPRLIDVYRRMVKAANMLVFPMMLGLAAVASPLIKFLLNEQWYGCIPMIQIICFGLIWQPTSNISINVISVVGRTDVLLKIEIIKRIAGVLSLFLSVPFGIFGVCVGFVCLYVFCFMVNSIAIGKTLGFPIFRLYFDLLPLFINASIMAILVFCICSNIQSPILSLITGLIVGISYYTISSRLFMKNTFNEALEMFKFKR